MTNTNTIIVEKIRKGYITVTGTQGRFENEILFEGATLDQCKAYIENNRLEGEVKMVGFDKVKKVLKNGVKQYALEVVNDFSEAQEILDISSYTSDFDAESNYNERDQLESLGTYEVFVDSKSEYDKFNNMFVNERYEVSNSSGLRQKIISLYRNDILDHVKASGALDILSNSYPYRDMTEKEKIEKIKEFLGEHFEKDYENVIKRNFDITFEEWKEGKASTGEKLGKKLRKNGYSQLLIDFYSAQEKTAEKKYFLTISDRVQHIAGMSNYKDLSKDHWTTYNGSSCQDTRHDYHECDMLVGSLHDDKLYIALLHENLLDVEEMQDKLLARSVLRMFEVDGEKILIGTNNYGTRSTIQDLENALCQLSENLIFSKNVKVNCEDRIQINTNGGIIHTATDTVTIDREIEGCETIECPMCSGTGDYSTYSDNCDSYVTIVCPSCYGDGEREIEFSYWVEDEVEVEVEGEELLPYAEGYSHSGNYVSMRVDLDTIKEYIALKKEIEFENAVNEEI